VFIDPVEQMLRRLFIDIYLIPSRIFSTQQVKPLQSSLFSFTFRGLSFTAALFHVC